MSSIERASFLALNIVGGGGGGRSSVASLLVQLLMMRGGAGGGFFSHDSVVRGDGCGWVIVVGGRIVVCLGSLS